MTSSTGMFSAVWDRMVRRGWRPPANAPAREVSRAYALAMGDMATHAELVGTGRCPCLVCRDATEADPHDYARVRIAAALSYLDNPIPATAFEQAAKDAGESEDLRLRLLATEVDVLGASPLEAARVLFGGPDA